MKFSLITWLSLLLTALVPAVNARADYDGAGNSSYSDSYEVQLDTESVGCTNLRLDEGQGSMAHVPVVDQKGLGVCYSAAAAQMADAWRFSHGDTDYLRQTSFLVAAVDTGEAEDLAKTYQVLGKTWTFDHRRTDVTGGYAGDVLSYLHSHESCDSMSLPGFLGFRDPAEVVGKLSQAYFDYRLWALAHTLGQALDNPSLGGDRSAVTDRAAACMRDLGFQSGQIPEAKEILDLAAGENPMLLVKKTLDHACAKGRFHSGIPAPTVDPASTPDDLRDAIEGVLNSKNPQPVGLSLCANVLTEGGNYQGECSAHEVLITGRRFDPATNSCQYLIRNSWGKSCVPYAKNPEVTCDGQGNVWVGRVALLKHSWNVTYLKD